jgi:hypothetical protein
MMGMRMPETCHAVFKGQEINLRDWCIWLVDLFEQFCCICCDHLNFPLPVVNHLPAPSSYLNITGINQKKRSEMMVNFHRQFSTYDAEIFNTQILRPLSSYSVPTAADNDTRD